MNERVKSIEEKNADHQNTQHQIQLLCGLLKDLDLATFVERLDHADSVGALLDPTLYRDALQSGKWDLIKGTAGALLRAQQEITKVEARYLRDHPGEAARGK